MKISNLWQRILKSELFLDYKKFEQNVENSFIISISKWAGFKEITTLIIIWILQQKNFFNFLKIQIREVRD